MKQLYNKTEIASFSFFKTGIVYMTGNMRNRNVVFYDMKDDLLLLSNATIPTLKVLNKYIVAYSPNKTIGIVKLL
jgi:hypothetical protein